MSKMSTNQIILNVPIEWEKPSMFDSLTPEEISFVLKIGYQMVMEARELSTKEHHRDEIIQNLKNEMKQEIDKIQLEVLIEKETHKRMQLALKEEIENKYQLVIASKDEIIKYNFEMLKSKDEMLVQSQSMKSNHKKGRNGEEIFEYYAFETFRDFNGYQLLDTHKIAGSGDFHLKFAEFDVLVDAKNYKTNIPVNQREKIKNDLTRNEHLTFAWMVSLNCNIDKYDKSPVMYEWINSNQCIVYINKLLDCEDPCKLLRIVWFTCNELRKFLRNDDDISKNLDFEKMKNEKFQLIDKVSSLRKTIRQINASLNNTKNIVQLMDDEIKEILANQTMELVRSHYGIFEEWWNLNVEYNNNESDILSSTELWYKFRQQNKANLQQDELKIENFKDFLKSKVSNYNLIFHNGMKGSSNKSAFSLKGYIFVNNSVSCKKRKKDDSYFGDDDLDRKILNEYLENGLNILEIADLNAVFAWQIVSFLVSKNIINRRSDARGYDLYAQTEEYKSKFLKSK
jgi:hypothetical protein